MREVLRGTFQAALAATDPGRLTARHLAGWSGPAPARLLAFGKAAGPMLGAALERFPRTPALGILPDDAALPAAVEAAPHVQLLRAAHPLPDHRSVQAGEAALAEAERLPSGGVWLVLVSGGGSALLSRPQGVTLPGKAAVIRDLMHAGADIHALNTVRKHLSGVKGGRLAQAALARGAAVQALLLSDVVGDDPAVIASGPTVPDPTTFADARAVLERFGVAAPEVARHLARGEGGEVPDTPKALPGVTSRVIGSNRLLLDAAARHLRELGYGILDLGDGWAGEARDVAAQHARIVQEHLNADAPLALISGGEATVTVRGPGVGGRNHEFALALALYLGPTGVWGLSAGSDGLDGSSGAAGAVLTPDTLARAAALGLDAGACLARNDSGAFFAALGDGLVTGPTGQNLNDLRVLLVPPRRA